MGKSKRDSRGFTLIAALLLTLLLSALAVGLVFTVSNEVRMGGNDIEDTQAYYGSEAGMENLTAQLSQLYQTSQTPNAAAINALTTPGTAIYPTSISGSNITFMNYAESITWPPTDANGNPCPNPCGTWNIIGSGADQGLVATIIPFNLQVTASRQAGSGQIGAYSSQAASGASVNMSRTVEVALIPAFEFGVFCDGDCDYFAGPNFNFGGRVHTNGNLFLASGANLTFTDKIAAVGQVIVDQLENGHPTSAGYGGSLWAPNASGGCPGAPLTGPAANCVQLTAGSWTGGFYPVAGAANPAWTGISNSTFHGFILNGLTGATKLQLPFVQVGVGPIEITRKPRATDTALMANSRLYNRAEIRILLADSQIDLHPERGVIGDGQDVPLIMGNSQVITGGANMYYATANPGVNAGIGWTQPTGCGAPAQWSLLGQVTQVSPCVSPTWLRVEYLNSATGNWVGVTTQWLSYGFGRAYGLPPTTPLGGAGANTVSSAILILQQLQNGVGVAGATGAASTQYNWIPINFYDSREGEPRDAGTRGGTLCGPAGVMNAVELDVGNLWLWLQAAPGTPFAGGAGPLVNSTKDKGYILYFSDHRGMIADPDPPYLGTMAGSSLLEDVINSGSALGQPDGALEPIVYYAYSPEDVDQSGTLNQQGAQNLGAGFGVTAANVSQPYYISGVTAGISCPTTAAVNLVTGPRHAIRLVDGGMNAAAVSYVPGTNIVQANSIGFTVASEEPVYVLGDYNSGPSDPLWAGGNNNTQHAAAAIIADSVTLLSNPPSPATLPVANRGWTDAGSFNFPGDVTSAATTRKGNNSYYRLAIAAGKSIPFPQPAWGGQDFGTDGGMHNFLRYLENRGANGATVNYAGSLISMYYSQYATGTFKCCNVVYGAPTRNYFFDTLFLNPANLPPGTPMFQDVVSLSYHQGFAPQ
jgi:hypothetical protein